MRKQNAEFVTAFTSEADHNLKNTDYVGFVELDQYACYVVADGMDDALEAVGAKIAVDSVVSAFTEQPSIGKRGLNQYLHLANQALIQAKSKSKLKASILILVTDYISMRYGQAGNVRFRLYRDGFVKYQSIDQSLAMDMTVKEESGVLEPALLDKVAKHEERHNLYTYLGQNGDFKPFISKKIRLTNSDAIALYTKGIWQHIDEGELADVFAGADNHPETTVVGIEDLLLSRQPSDLNTYTLAVLCVNKIFVDPNKKRKWKKILMTAIPIAMVVVIVTVLLVVRYQKRKEQIEDLRENYSNTIEYIQMNYYVRAKEECNKAKELADQVNDKEMAEELGNYLKLIESVLYAEEKLEGANYKEAERLYQEALKRSRYVELLGEKYIREKLMLTADYIAVYDLIALGDSLVQYLQYDKAEEQYLKAKETAGSIYFDSGRESALAALEKLYALQQEQQKAQEEERNDQLAKEESVANSMVLGDQAFAQGEYGEAKVHYMSAQHTYEELGEEVLILAVEEKIKLVEEELSNQEARLMEAEEYVKLAMEKMEEEDLNQAKKYYLMARDIYASLKEQDKVDEMMRKMELLDMKKSEMEEKESKEAEAIRKAEEERAQAEKEAEKPSLAELKEQESVVAEQESEIESNTEQMELGTEIEVQDVN